jgi:hypothetical protein
LPVLDAATSATIPEGVRVDFGSVTCRHLAILLANMLPRTFFVFSDFLFSKVTQ